jgi:hypothetical protein
VFGFIYFAAHAPGAGIDWFCHIHTIFEYARRNNAKTANDFVQYGVSSMKKTKNTLDHLEKMTNDPDILWGFTNIGRVMNKSARVARYLAEIGAIRVRKVGGRYCVSRRELLRQVLGDSQ